MRARTRQLNKALSFLSQSPKRGMRSRVLFVQGDRLIGKSKFINDIRASLNSKEYHQCFLIKQPIFQQGSGCFELFFQSILERLNNDQSSNEIDGFIRGLIDMECLDKYFRLIIPFYRKKIRQKIRKSLLENNFQDLIPKDSIKAKLFCVEYLLGELYPETTITFFVDNIENQNLPRLKKALQEYNSYYYNDININIVLAIPLSKKAFQLVNNIISDYKNIQYSHIWLNPLYFQKYKGRHSSEDSLSFSPIIPGILHPSELKSDFSPNIVFQRITQESYYSLLNVKEIATIKIEQQRFLCALSYLSFAKFDDVNAITKATGSDFQENMDLFDNNSSLAYCIGNYYFKDAWRAYLSVRFLREHYYNFLNEFVVGCIALSKQKFKIIQSTYKRNRIYINPHIDKQYNPVIKKLFQVAKNQNKASQEGLVSAAETLFTRIKRYGPFPSPFFIKGVYSLFTITQNLDVLDFVLDCIEIDDFDRMSKIIEIIPLCIRHAVQWNDVTLANRLLKITNNDTVFFNGNQDIYIGRLKILCLFCDFNQVKNEMVLLARNKLLSNRFDVFIEKMISFANNINDTNLSTYFQSIESTYYDISIRDLINRNQSDIIERSVMNVQNNYIIDSKVQNAQFQQGNGQQKMMNETNFDLLHEVSAVLTEIKSDIENLKLLDDAKKDIDAEINTVEAQLKSSDPKPRIFKESLQTIRNIAEGAVGGILANGVWAKLPIIIEAIDRMIK